MYSINVEFHKDGNRCGFFILKQSENLDNLVDRYTQIVSNYKVYKERSNKPIIYIEHENITDYDAVFISLDNEETGYAVSAFSINFEECH